MSLLLYLLLGDDLVYLVECVGVESERELVLKPVRGGNRPITSHASVRSCKTARQTAEEEARAKDAQKWVTLEVWRLRLSRRWREGRRPAEVSSTASVTRRGRDSKIKQAINHDLTSAEAAITS